MTVDIMGPSATLEELFRSKRGAPNADLLRRGDALATIRFNAALAAQNSEFSSQFQTVMIDIFEDLADGAPVLLRNSIGLAVAGGKLLPFIRPNGQEAPPETLENEAFSVSLQPMPTVTLLGEDDACAVIYRLIAFSALESGL